MNIYQYNPTNPFLLEPNRFKFINELYNFNTTNSAMYTNCRVRFRTLNIPNESPNVVKCTDIIHYNFDAMSDFKFIFHETPPLEIKFYLISISEYLVYRTSFVDEVISLPIMFCSTSNFVNLSIELVFEKKEEINFPLMIGSYWCFTNDIRKKLENENEFECDHYKIIKNPNTILTIEPKLADITVSGN